MPAPRLKQPYVLETTSPSFPEPTNTATPTPAPTGTVTGTPTVTATGTTTATTTATLPEPSGDADSDGRQNWWDTDPDGDGSPGYDEPGYEDPSYSSYGPSYLSSCTLSSGEDGAKIQYYDPEYNTTSLSYNVTGPGGAVYNGTETFDAPVGYWTECVAGRVTNNVTQNNSAAEVGLRDNATFRNGSIAPLESDFNPGGGGPQFQSFGPMGDPADSPAEQATAFGLAGLGVGASYLLGRRTDVLGGLQGRLPGSVSPVFLAGSAASVAMGLEFSSGGAVSAAAANGVQRVAPLAGLGAVGYGAYWMYKRFIASQDVTVPADGE